MEYLITLKEEITLATLLIALIVASVKGFFISQFQQLVNHIKRKQKVYYVTCGVVGTFLFFVLLIFFNSKVEKNKEQIEFFKKNLNSLKDGSSDNDYDSFKKNIVSFSKRNLESYRDYLKYSPKKTYDKFWVNNHISIVFGKIILKENEPPVFQYFNITGKDPKSEKIQDVLFYKKSNKLFRKQLPIEIEDYKAIKKKRVCFNQPVFWSQKEKGDCYWLKTLKKTTKLKTMNNIEEVIYAITTYVDEDNSKGFFWFSVNSAEPFYNTEMMHRFGTSVQDFIMLSNKYVNSKLRFIK
jgi:hypothetical protein